MREKERARELYCGEYLIIYHREKEKEREREWFPNQHTDLCVLTGSVYPNQLNALELMDEKGVFWKKAPFQYNESV